MIKKRRLLLVFCISAIIHSGIAGVSAADDFAGLQSYIDEHNRFILNGEPFFPLGLYVVQCTNGSYTTELDEIADSPFDTLMNYAINECGTEASYQQIRDYLDELARRDLKVIFSLKEYVSACDEYAVCDNPGPLSADAENIITQKVNNHMDHESVIAWYLNDETCPDCLEQLEDGYNLIQRLDSNHPVWSVHWNTTWLLQEAHTTDIVGADSYPIPDNPITWVLNVVDDAMQAGKPLWFVPQLFEWPNKRPPSKEEMRAMTYLAVNHGAKGLIYYSYFDIRNDGDYSERWSAIKDIAGEIDQVRDVFLSTQDTTASDVVCNVTDIDLKLMKKDDTYYLFAVNTKEEAVPGVSFSVNLNQTPSVVDTLFESGRQIPVTNASFEDDFSTYEVHVYQWDEEIVTPPVVIENARGLKEPNTRLKINGSGFGDTQAASVVHLGDRTYDQTAERIESWSDTQIAIRLPNYPCSWFLRDTRKLKVWVTVGGVDSNVFTVKVLKPDTCP
jgi:hypothetical protein